MPKQTHEMNNFDSEMERRFQEETKRIKAEDHAVLDRFSDHHDIEEPGVLDGIRRRWIGFGSVAAAAVALTAIGVGKTTIAEHSPAQPNIPAMQEHAKQLEEQGLAHAHATGEPLISDQR